MPTVKIPINGHAYKNVGAVSLTNHSEALINGFVDESESTNKRPGLLEWINLNTNKPIDGLFFWDKKDLVIAVSNGVIFKITSGAIVTEITGAILNVSGRVLFAVHGDILAMANGGKIVTTDGTTATEMADADAPTRVTHLGFIDQYLLANNALTDIFYFSDVGNPLSWDPLEFATAELRSDNINALFATAWGEVYLWGRESLEPWINDGVNPFSPFPGAQTTRGTIAPYSVVLAGQTFYYLDPSKQIVRLEGRQAVPISNPFRKIFQELTTVNDAIADFMEIEGRAFYVISFPTEKLTFAYDIDMASWAQWSYWDSSVPENTQWLVSSYCHPYLWGFHLAGDRRNNGKIHKLSMAHQNDAEDLIRYFRRTGHIDHGTLNKKRSNFINIKLKRGTASTGNLAFRWRDDGENLWSNEHLISLGNIGETEFIKRIYTRGIYRTRQYEFTLTDATQLTLVGAEENIDVLTR